SPSAAKRELRGSVIFIPRAPRGRPQPRSVSCGSCVASHHDEAGAPYGNQTRVSAVKETYWPFAAVAKNSINNDRTAISCFTLFVAVFASILNMALNMDRCRLASGQPHVQPEGGNGCRFAGGKHAAQGQKPGVGFAGGAFTSKAAGNALLQIPRSEASPWLPAPKGQKRNMVAQGLFGRPAICG